jgi:hypothetical protein
MKITGKIKLNNFTKSEKVIITNGINHNKESKTRRIKEKILQL